MNGNIFLRNQSQLLQGTTGTGSNVGLGSVSIFQEGTVNNYQYNYWCSPVGIPSLSSGNKNFGISRLFQPTGLISSSNSIITNNLDGISNPLTISQYWIYTFTTSNTYSQWNYVGSNNLILPGFGFTMKGTSGTDSLIVDINDGIQNNSGSNQRYDFRGVPNDGTITLPVTSGNFTLIGNPYPSSIDLNSFLLDPLNSSLINGQVYFWEQVPVNSHYLNAYSGGYGIYTPGAGYTPAAFWNFDSSGNYETNLSTSGAFYERRFSPVGQGFMVKGTANGNLTMKNSYRVYRREGAITNSEFARESNSEYFESIPNLAGIDYTQVKKGFVPQMRIHAMYNNGGIRPTTLGFDSNTTDGFDYGFDGVSSSRESAEFYYILNDSDKEFIINVTNFDINKRIPVGFRCQAQTNFKIKVVDVLYGFDSSQKVYIHDKETNIYYDIKDHMFEVTLPAGDNKTRFEITFNTTNDILSSPQEEHSILQVFQDTTLELLKIINPEKKEIISFELYDTTGKLVISNKYLDFNSEISISTSNLSTGLYIVKIKTIDGLITNDKIIIN
ncbi:T9SS type A sorting domain-containing protein [uncultured Flavobacterium sp.]|uniref:T9SS type A sorting domain-containing protein n=3 Tax=Flavobacterium TaxID=237 RepID=UPI0026276F17|nr:T9SS type A sorting domain-containing protein [uncultured Flavobacterium sp.]